MQCPECRLGKDADHRKCVIKMFRENRIQSVEDWECMSRTILKGRRVIRILKSSLSASQVSTTSTA